MINHTLQTFHLIFNMEFSVDEHKNIFNIRTEMNELKM